MEHLVLLTIQRDQHHIHKFPPSSPSPSPPPITSATMSDYALDVDVGLLLPSDFLFDVLHPFPSDAQLVRGSNSFFEFGPVVRPQPPGFRNGVSQCDAGGPVNHRLQLPETEKPPVESSSFTARSGPGGWSIGSRGYGGTGVFLPRAVARRRSKSRRQRSEACLWESKQ